MSTKSVAKAAGLIAVASLISRLLGFLREAILSGFFGKSYITDAYNAGFAVPNLFYQLLVVGALSSAFIPVLSGYIAKKNKDEAWNVASTVITLVVLVLSAITLIAMIFTPQIIALYIPDAPLKTKLLAVPLTRILLIQPIILSISGFSMGILNSLKIFGPPAFGSVIYTASVIVVGSLLEPVLGIKGFALGVVLGALGNFLVQVPALRKVGFRYRFSLDFHHPGVKRIATLALPMILAFSLNQIPVIVYQNLASALPVGSLSSFNYAYKLQQLPIGIFAYSVGLAIFPTLTEAISLKRWQQFRSSFSLALRSIMFLTIPISVGMIVLAEPLIHVVFQHGAFTAQDTKVTIPPLIFFAVGIVEQSATVIIPRTFYALQDTWTPVLLGFISLVVNIVLMEVLVGPLAQGGLALAISISGIVNMLLLLYALKRKIKFIDGRRILNSLAKIVFGSLLMGIVLNQVYHLTSSLGIPGWFGAAFNLAVGSIIGALVFLILAVLLRMQELGFVLQVMRRRIAR